MNVIQRIDILEKTGNYILSEDPEWQEIKERAYLHNNWFVPAFIERSIQSIATNFLERKILEHIAAGYAIPREQVTPRTVGIVMAGNLPLVGFHDLCCVFLCGHRAKSKTSSQDNILLPHLIKKILEWEPSAAAYLQVAEMLKGCDAYIATGSNQSAVYFHHYFGKYPHIIRRNRTAAAILTGKETPEELSRLSDDVFMYFGRGCRNVTKIFVPAGYDFLPLLESFQNYRWLSDHHKFRNNYEYQLALLIINKKYYMTNGTLLLLESPSLFAPIGLLHYEFYEDRNELEIRLRLDPDIQCIAASNGHIPFGKTQEPVFTDFADGVDTLQFLLEN